MGFTLAPGIPGWGAWIGMLVVETASCCAGCRSDSGNTCAATASATASGLWDGDEAIIAACCDAWNKLMRMPDRIASFTRREWARVVAG